jgi:phage shock protein A
MPTTDALSERTGQMTDEEWKVALEIVLDIRRTLARMSADAAEISRTFDRMEARMDRREARIAAMAIRAPQGSCLSRWKTVE